MDLPKDYKNKFISLLDELEQKTGNLYQLDIQQFNVTEKITLNEFSSRSCQVEVYNMIHPYQKLNGIYPNLSAVNEKIKQLHNMEKEKDNLYFNHVVMRQNIMQLVIIVKMQHIFTMKKMNGHL